MSKFRIEDWAGNILDYSDVFMRPHYAVAKEFPTFEEAWNYLYRKFDHLSEKEFDEEMSEYYVEEVSHE